MQAGPLDGHTCLPDRQARPWPEDVVMSPEVKALPGGRQALVDRRWREYGIEIE